MAKFELVKRFENQTELLPKRGTGSSAGYDLFVAEDIIIPSYQDIISGLEYEIVNAPEDMNKTETSFGNLIIPNYIFDLSQIAEYTKKCNAKPALVSTGVKCKLASNEYLELTARSSTPLKYWLIVANAPAIIDSDYYNNESNEGEIFLQLINLFPYPIQLRKGDRLGQGIIKTYNITEDDEANGSRCGGFGSTN